MATSKSAGQILAAMLADSLSSFKIGPVIGDHTREIVWGVTPDGSLVGGMTLDGFLDKSGRILRDCGRFYVFGNTVVYETAGAGDHRLSTLALNHRAEPNAAPTLANHFGVAAEGRPGEFVQSLAATKLVNALLADEALWRNLPEVRFHARRPTFDADYNLCHPGWNPTSGILVHFGEVDPTPTATPHAADAYAVDRLPPLLTGLFREFSWRSDADLANAVAMLLTGLLVNHFVDDPHPGVIVDANQPGTGKTLLVQAIGRILDGAEPPRVSIVRDEELEKKLCAQLRTSRTSLFFFDNVRDRIESAVIEQNMLSPLLSFRVLGKSASIERPNTFLWFITSNMAAGTPDFIRRCVPIRLFFDGDPKARVFKGNPLAYAAEHRLGILGELAGMVVRWVQQSKPKGPHKHRCDRWAAVVGGILGANGLGEFFLANADEAEAQMDQGLVDLATLAEHAVAKGLADLHAQAGGSGEGKGRVPGQWVPVFAETLTLRDKFVDAGPKGKATAVGMFLSGKVGRPVPVETADGPRQATLRRRGASGGQKLYYFEIAAPPPKDGQPAQSPAALFLTAPLTSNGDSSTPTVTGEAGGEPPAVVFSTPALIPGAGAGNGAPGESDLAWL